MPKPAPVVVPMELEKSTKSMVRYQNNEDKTTLPKLYVDKELIKKWGNPENLNVTLEAP